MKDKLKVNMGFLAFKKAKVLQPMKFQYREAEKQDVQVTGGNVKYSKFFKQNPELIEFMKVGGRGDDDEEKEAAPKKPVKAKAEAKKKRQKSLLVSDKRLKGSKVSLSLMLLVYDRFYDPTCPKQRDLRTRSATPGAGTYFLSCAPVRVQGIGGVKLIYPKVSLV